MNVSLIFLLFLILKFNVILTYFCKNVCICQNELKNIFCKDKYLKIIPLNIPINVEKLDLSKNIFNNISSNVFSKLINLKKLNIDHCEIKSIAKNAFEGLTELKELYLTNNDIHTLHVDTFVNLKHLLHVYLTNNEFQNIPPLKSFSITRLNLDGNLINNAKIDESFKINTNLRTLVLTNNKIGLLNISDFINLRNTGLQSLMLKMNNLDYIHPLTFEPVKDTLQTLELEGNPLLTSLQIELALRAFSGGSKLIFLDLKNTGLTNISRNFFQPLVTSNLHRLDISNNPQLSNIDDDAFHELDKVQILVADKCRISSSNIKLSALNALKELNLGHNLFTNCPRHLPGSLLKIDLSHNEIRNIIKDDFKSLSSLTSLNLANNAIANIELESFADLVQLVFLDLSHNRLTTIIARTFVSLSSLSILNLQQQSPCLKVIEANSFVLYNLLKLDLSRNCIDSATLKLPVFSQCPRLSDIILRSNNIEDLTNSFFHGCRNLSFLDLSHNNIKGWSQKTFISLASTLANLDLSFNDLSNLSIVSSERNFLPKYFSKLQNISLANNHWNCSCTAVGWILSYKNFLHSGDKIICEHPNDKRGRKLLYVDEMKDCPVQVMIPGQQPSKGSSSRRALISILLVFFGIVICVGCYFMRKRLRREFRRFSRWASKNTYSPMYNTNSSEPRSFDNPILEEDIPDMSQSCLVINDHSLTNSDEEESYDNWIIPISLNPYEAQDDVVYLSKLKNVEVTKIQLKIIDNLESFENKVASCHCSKLVVDYPPLDIDLLKVIIEERKKERPEDEENRNTYLFHRYDIDEGEYGEFCQLFEADHIIRYNPSNFEDILYDIF